jgi:hypothetical protein
VLRTHPPSRQPVPAKQLLTGSPKPPNVVRGLVGAVRVVAVSLTPLACAIPFEIVPPSLSCGLPPGAPRGSTLPQATASVQPQPRTAVRGLAAGRSGGAAETRGAARQRPGCGGAGGGGGGRRPAGLWGGAKRSFEFPIRPSVPMSYGSI